MNKTFPYIFTLILCTLGGLAAFGAPSYWDVDGPIPGGSGDTTASGTWGVDNFWSPSPFGDAITGAWSPGDDAFFSAGTNVTGVSTITIADTQTAGNLTVQAGTFTFTGGNSLNLGGGSEGKGFINIAAGLTTTINSVVEGGDDTGRITKTGAGTLVLNGANNYGGVTVISTGVVAIANASALGSSLAPTVVSNDATLQLNSALTLSEPVTLHGHGAGGNGALRSAGGGNRTWAGKVTLGADARIEHAGAGNLVFTTAQLDGISNPNGSANLTVGGNGSLIRFNINANPGINLGSGALIKEGAAELRFEVPSVIGGLFFNAGHILWRNNLGAGTSLITVGAGAGQIRTGTTGPSVTVPNPFALSAGANPVFSITPNFVFTASGVISGSGGLTKGNTGTLSLLNSNTYTGTTTIAAGTLLLGAGASISNTPVIDVQTNATFDVASLPNGFVLGPGQTLKGNGTVQGNVVSAGTLSPGTAIGNLAFSGNLTLYGNVLIEVNNSSVPAHDTISVSGVLTNAGSGLVIVTNLGPALTVGESFQLFNQPVLNGDALTVISPGVVWTNKLAVDGSISVVSTGILPTIPATNLTIESAGFHNFKLGGTGAANSPYHIYATTNLATPATNWWWLGTATSDANGLIQFVDSSATNAQRFYRFAPQP